MSTIDLDRALAADRAVVASRVLALREDQWFDRKSIRVQAKDLGPPMVAFANAEGGVLVLGLYDGKAEGLKRHHERLNDFQQAALDHTVPPVRARVEQVGCINEHGEIDTIVVPQRRALRESGLFESAPIVPRDAWLEGLVNAVIHRSYSLGGDHIRVEIFTDRVEIESPGRFPGLADPAHPLDISRFARNPRIARVCADLRIGQELGEGIRRIFEEMRRVGLTDPVYEQGQASLRLRLTSMSRLDLRTAARLPSRAQDILDALRVAGRDLGTGELVQSLGLSRPAVKIRLDALEREGLVRWIGKSERDPRAVWSLVE